MARRRFRIFGTGADKGIGGPGKTKPTSETRPSPPAPALGSDAREWTIGDDPARAAAVATAPAEGAEALVPRELQANGSSASSDSVPDAAEWLPGGDQPRERSRVAPEAAARPAAELSGKAVQPVEPDAPNPIAAMAAEAESFAVESEAATASEPVLEPPSWVAAKQPEGPAPEPDAKPEPEAKPKPEPAAKPAPEAERRPPAAPEPKEVAEDRLSLSLAEFEELRGLGMSVTQAKRVIRYRDERNGFRTLDELDQVPGFPRSFLSGVKERVVP